MNDFVIILKNMLLPVLTVEKVTTETFEDFIDQITQKYYITYSMNELEFCEWSSSVFVVNNVLGNK